jgi:hypothetical protein
VTTDEELAFFEDSVRRLKVEYDIYFGGGSRRAPTELDWRVQGLIKKYSDSQRLTSPQRFKYNTVVQRYAIYSDLWRQKLRIKEEGYRRPQDALLGIQGLRTVEASQSPQRAGLAGDPDQSAVAPPKQSAVLLFADSDELDGIRWLYETMQSSGGEGKARGSLEAFAAFLRAKTKEIQNTYGCSGVKYTVEVKNGRAQIKARPNL